MRVARGIPGVLIFCLWVILYIFTIFTFLFLSFLINLEFTSLSRSVQGWEGGHHQQPSCHTLSFVFYSANFYVILLFMCLSHAMGVNMPFAFTVWRHQKVFSTRPNDMKHTTLAFIDRCVCSNVRRICTGMYDYWPVLYLATAVVLRLTLASILPFGARLLV